MNAGGYVVESQRSGSWGPLSSVRTLWTRFGTKNIYSPYERPPFPIKVDQPAPGDIYNELRAADLVMFMSIYGAGIAWAYVCSRPMVMLSHRLIAFHGISHACMVTSLCLTLTMPYRRLTGYADNGLRWTTPSDKLKKFDATSHFEAATIWKRWRIKPDE